MRIAVLHNLPSGGGMRSLVRVLQHLVRSHEVALYLPAGAERSFLAPEAHVPEVHVYPWQAPAVGDDLSPPRRLRAYLERLRRLEPVYRVMARDVDGAGHGVVLVNPCSVFYSPPALRFLRTPSVYLMQEVFRYVHDKDLARPYRGRLRRWLGALLYGPYKARLRRSDRDAARAATRIVANSRFEGDLIARTYGVPARVEYPEVDARAFSPPEPGPREPYVLSVGRIEPLKAHDFLVRAVARVEEPLRPRLELVGDRAYPAERSYVEDLARRLGVELRARLQVSEGELLDAYRRASAFVYAPVNEPFGYGALEAQATATPVVGVAEGGLKETVVDGVTGLLTPRDEGAFAAALRRLLVDPALAARMGAAGRAHVEEHWSRTGFGARIAAHLVEVAGAAP